jgi:hypothetical protein
MSDEAEVLTSAGRRFRRSESGRKSRPALFEMTGGDGERMEKREAKRGSSTARPGAPRTGAQEKAGPLRSE